MSSSIAHNKEELARQLHEAKQTAEQRAKQVARPDVDDYIIEQIGHQIWQALRETAPELESNAYYTWEMRRPPSHVDADIALQVFNVAEYTEHPPEQLAAQLADRINEADLSYIASAKAEGAFCNIHLQRQRVYADLLAQIHKLGGNYGTCNKNADTTALVEFSSPNIAKPMGAGHLRSTIIGAALSNIYEATGAAVIRENYLGDWGAQFGKLLYAYQQWGDEEAIKTDPIQELHRLYVQFHQQSNERPDLEKEAAELGRQLERGDEELLKQWRQCKELSIEVFQHVYEKLGVTFDLYNGESYFVEDARQAIADCLHRGACTEQAETGAVVAESLDGLPTFLLQRADGTTLYQARELALLQFRIQKASPDSIDIVVGNEQELYFRQLKALTKELGYLTDDTRFRHVGFGMMLTEDGKRMSTRRGTAVQLEELLDEAVDRAKHVIQEKNSDITGEELEEVAHTVGVGAVIYNDLRQSRTRNITFDWDRMLDLEGGSAAYLQYTAVRLTSVAKRLREEYGDEVGELDADALTFTEESEMELARMLLFFPYVILTAQQTQSPHFIATYLEELAQACNTFYNAVPVKGTGDPSLRASRVQLITAVREVLEQGLALLNIRVPPRM